MDQNIGLFIHQMNPELALRIKNNKEQVRKYFDKIADQNKYR